MRLMLAFLSLLLVSASSAPQAAEDDCPGLTRALYATASIFNEIAEKAPEGHPAYMKAKQDAAEAFRRYKEKSCGAWITERSWTLKVTPPTTKTPPQVAEK